MMKRHLTVFLGAVGVALVGCGSIERGGRTRESIPCAADMVGLWINEGEPVSLAVGPDCRCEIRYQEMEQGTMVAIPGTISGSGTRVTMRLERPWWYGSRIDFERRDTATQKLLWIIGTDDSSVSLPPGGLFGFSKAVGDTKQ